jgi:hypothetical protein
MIEGKFEIGALVSLRDLLGLYKKGLVNTTLSAGQIASAIFSMPTDSTLRQVLMEMFTRRFRRIFLGDDENAKALTDRRIISYVFSTSRLSEVAHSPSNLLDTTVDKLEAMQPSKVSGKSKVKDVARVMMGEIEECLVCEKEVSEIGQA